MIGLSAVLLLGSCNTERKPNLLIIHTDEHNFRTLGCYRDQLSNEQGFVWGPGVEVKTPNIDRIADEGAICNSFYAANPVCSPSRASFVSGMYPVATDVVKNDIPLKDGLITFAEVLRQAGYATSYVGKWHLDGDAKPGFEPERKFGFDDNRYMINRGHWKQAIEHLDSIEVRLSGKMEIDESNTEEFFTDWLVTKTIEIIRRDKDQPFCHMLSLPDPHGPNRVRTPYDKMYEHFVFQDPPTMGIPVDERPGWSFGKNSTDSLEQGWLQQIFGMVKCIDDNIGRILQVLEEEGLAETTIVVFTSDHGDLMGEHNKHNKSSPYEASAKIPFLVRYPGKINPGKVINKAYTTTDFAPTILGLMGQEQIPGSQGIDASSDFTGKGTLVENDRIVYITTAMGSWLAAVNNRYKLVISTEDDPWFYDLQKDPDELVNFYSNPDYASLVKEFEIELLRQMKAYDEPALKAGKYDGWAARLEQ